MGREFCVNAYLKHTCGVTKYQMQFSFHYNDFSISFVQHFFVFKRFSTTILKRFTEFQVQIKQKGSWFGIMEKLQMVKKHQIIFFWSNYQIIACTNLKVTWLLKSLRPRSIFWIVFWHPRSRRHCFIARSAQFAF